jgi:hypothetical protein
MFLKLQEAALNKQAKAKWQGYKGNTNSTSASQQGNIGIPQGQDQPNQGCNNDEGYVPSKGHITAMIQPAPKSNKEEKSITQQVNLVVTLPPAIMEYLHWSEQPIEFSSDDHPITVPQPKCTSGTQSPNWDIRRRHSIYGRRKCNKSDLREDSTSNAHFIRVPEAN